MRTQPQHKLELVVDRDSVRAMPLRGRSAALQAEPVPVSVLRTAAAIAGPSPEFVARGRNASLAEAAVRERPRFEPTVKGENDVVI